MVMERLFQMKCSIQLGFALVNETIHLSPHVIFGTVTLINIYYLYNTWSDNTVTLKCFDIVRLLRPFPVFRIDKHGSFSCDLLTCVAIWHGYSIIQILYQMFYHI